MTTQITAPPNGRRPASARPADPVRLRPSSRPRSGPLVGLGVLVVVGSALAFAVTATHLGSRQAVLALTRAVPAGGVIDQADLAVVHVSADPRLRPLAAAQLSSIVGRTAAVPLAPGSLLVASELGPASALGPDQAGVGVSLKAGQYPPDLAAGMTVSVVDVGAPTTALPTTPAPPGQTVVAAATVTSVSTPADTSSSDATVVGLVVPAAEADQVAALAGAGRLALVEVSAQP